MNEKNLTSTAFWAMVHRDLLVQWRDKWEFVFRVGMLPFILILVYGYMLPAIGILPAGFPTHMFCGMIGMSMLITLLDPLTWVNEAIRGIMTPQIDSLPLPAALIGVVVWIAVLGLIAFRRFNKMVYNH